MYFSRPVPVLSTHKGQCLPIVKWEKVRNTRHKLNVRNRNLHHILSLNGSVFCKMSSSGLMILF
uniref:Uncharacterized protein n=1 Tax=Anguilla anguilla TaxID=7936 RepID=A0A0E9X3M7_ANGAN